MTDCPECGRELQADFVDNGVGNQRVGPWWCDCGWFEDVNEDEQDFEVGEIE